MSQDNLTPQQQKLAHQYILGQLESEQLAEFELMLLEHPNLAEQVELDLTFKHGMTLQPLAKPTKRSQSLFKSLIDLPRVWVTSFAFASVIIALQLAVLMKPEQNSGLGQITYLETFRSKQNNQIFSAVLEQHTENLILVIQPPVLEAAQYMVTITREKSTTPILTLNRIQVEGMQDIVLTIPRSVLHPDNYVIHVYKAGEKQPANRYQLKVVLPKT